MLNIKTQIIIIRLISYNIRFCEYNVKFAKKKFHFTSSQIKISINIHNTNNKQNRILLEEINF